jgi:hypothetical protein
VVPHSSCIHPASAMFDTPYFCILLQLMGRDLRTGSDALLLAAADAANHVITDKRVLADLHKSSRAQCFAVLSSLMLFKCKQPGGSVVRL